MGDKTEVHSAPEANPTLKVGIFIAMGLELGMLGVFVWEKAWVGVFLWSTYSYFSATWALVERRIRR